MINFLLIVNILLAIGVVSSFGSNIKSLKGSKEEITVPKRQPKKNVASGKDNVQEKAPTVEENISTILDGDIFNPERTPNTGGPNSGRVEMTLAGTFKVGNVSGAIVVMRTHQRQVNPFMPHFSFGPGGRFGGDNQRNASGRLMSTRMRFTQFGQQNSNNIRGGQSGKLSTGNRQCVKVGESLSNGYTLVEVGRASATLVRGSDRVELILQDPSKVKSSGNRGGGRRLTTAQQLQQAQIATQQQMMRVMQNMQRNMNNGGGGGRGFGSGRGGRR